MTSNPSHAIQARHVGCMLALLAAAALSACGGGGDSAGTSTGSTGSSGGSGGTSGTAGVLCSLVTSVFNAAPSVNATSTSSWSCSSSTRLLAANGLPDHAVGTFPNANNPNAISAQSVSASLTLSPVAAGTTTQLGGPAGTTGYVLNGVKIDPGTGGSCAAR